MDQSLRPWRSVLYLPASNARALEKAATLAADAIIFDLEDAVAVSEKAAARDALAGALAAIEYRPRARIVRINGLDSPWWQADLAAMAAAAPDAILVPKVDAPADLDTVAARAGDVALWAMMETPRAMLNAGAIAAHPRLAGMVMGTNDLAKDLGARYRPDRLPMLAGLGLCLLAARAHDLVIVDGVYNAFKDDDGLRAECEQGRDMGFDGKTLIHPAQLAVANTAFAPAQAEVDLAHRHIAAFDAAHARGDGVAVVDGKIVENLHVETARKTLARAAAIAALAKD